MEGNVSIGTLWARKAITPDNGSIVLRSHMRSSICQSVSTLVYEGIKRKQLLSPDSHHWPCAWFSTFMTTWFLFLRRRFCLSPFLLAVVLRSMQLKCGSLPAIIRRCQHIFRHSPRMAWIGVAIVTWSTRAAETHGYGKYTAESR